LELHALLDHRQTATALKQRLLNLRETTAQHTDDEVVLVVGLRARRPTAVELLQQRDHPVGNRRQHIAAGTWSDRWISSAHRQAVTGTLAETDQP
jgi:hypothetical protein